MKIRTWEKWYWGIALILATFLVVGICRSEKLRVTIGNNPTKTYTDFKDKLKAGLIIAAIVIGVAFLIWLLIRLFSKND